MNITIGSTGDVPTTKFRNGWDWYKCTDLGALSIYGLAFTFKMLDEVFANSNIDRMAIDVPEELDDENLKVAVHEMLAFGYEASILSRGCERSYSGAKLIDCIKVVRSKTEKRKIEIRFVQSTARKLHMSYQNLKAQMAQPGLSDVIIGIYSGGEKEDEH